MVYYNSQFTEHKSWVCTSTEAVNNFYLRELLRKKMPLKHGKRRWMKMRRLWLIKITTILLWMSHVGCNLRLLHCMKRVVIMMSTYKNVRLEMHGNCIYVEWKAWPNTAIPSFSLPNPHSKLALVARGLHACTGIGKIMRWRCVYTLLTLGAHARGLR